MALNYNASFQKVDCKWQDAYAQVSHDMTQEFQSKGSLDAIVMDEWEEKIDTIARKLKKTKRVHEQRTYWDGLEKKGLKTDPT